MDKTEIKLGDQIFAVAELDPWVTFPLQQRLWPAVSEVITLAISNVKDVDKVEDLLNLDLKSLDLSLFSESVTRICHLLPQKEVRALMDELLAFSTVIVNGKSLPLTGPGGQFSIVMKGRTMDTWRLLFHAVKVNYPDFFGLLGAKSGAPAVVSPVAT